MHKTLLFLVMLATTVATGTAQSSSQPADTAQQAELRRQIGLDLSLPDYTVHKAKASVVGRHLSAMLSYLAQNYSQTSYNRRLSSILGEQHEALACAFVEVQRLKLVSISQHGGEIVITYRATLFNNPVSIHQADLVFRFVDGVSPSAKVNDLFREMSHYVKVREELDSGQKTGA